MKKSGRPIHGADHDRNGAGTARRQIARCGASTWSGAIMRLPLQRWLGHHLQPPVGLALYRKEARANKRKGP